MTLPAVYVLDHVTRDRLIDGAPACVTVMVVEALPPRTVTLAVRAEVEVLAAADITSSEPEAPDAGETVSHVWFDDAVHVPWFVTTTTACVPPVYPGAHVDCEAETEAGAADCETVNVLLTVAEVKVTVPLLAGPVLAVTETVALSPVYPLGGDTMIHDESEEAADQDPWFAVTVTSTLPAVYVRDHVVRDRLIDGAPICVTVTVVLALPARMVTRPVRDAVEDSPLSPNAAPSRSRRWSGRR